MARKFPAGCVVASHGCGHSAGGLGGSHGPLEAEDEDTIPDDDAPAVLEDDAPDDGERDVLGEITRELLPAALEDGRARLEEPDPPVLLDALVEPEDATVLLLVGPLLLDAALLLPTGNDDDSGLLVEPAELVDGELLCPTEEPRDVPLAPTLPLEPTPPLEPLVLPAAWQMPSGLHT